jgi:hypothetical protein
MHFVNTGKIRQLQTFTRFCEASQEACHLKVRTMDFGTFANAHPELTAAG